MNAYRGKHVSSASRRSAPSFRRGRHQVRNRHRRRWLIFVIVLILLLFFGWWSVDAHWLLMALCAWVCLITLWSGVDYFVRNRDALKSAQ